MENYLEVLRAQKRELDLLLKRSEKNLAGFRGLPECRVKVSRSNGHSQFYFVDAGAGTCVYAKNGQRRLVRRIVQRDYERAVNRKIREQRRALELFLARHDAEAVKLVYSSLPAAKQEMVTPIVETDEEFVARWIEEHPGGQNPIREERNVRTAKGECVRSKSEKIIADLLAGYQVPYSYEPRIMLKSGRSFYPDFAVLNVRKRKTIYWEHLGMINVDEYACKNLQKIDEYDKAGFVPGENLIITMERSGDVFDSRRLEEKLQRYCL